MDGSASKNSIHREIGKKIEHMRIWRTGRTYKAVLAGKIGTGRGPASKTVGAVPDTHLNRTAGTQPLTRGRSFPPAQRGIVQASSKSYRTGARGLSERHSEVAPGAMCKGGDVCKKTELELYMDSAGFTPLASVGTVASKDVLHNSRPAASRWDRAICMTPPSFPSTTPLKP